MERSRHVSTATLRGARAVAIVCAVLFLFGSLFWLARWTFFSAYLGVTLFAAFTLVLTLVQK